MSTQEPAPNSSDPVEAAQAHLDVLTRRFAKDVSLTPVERAGLVREIKATKSWLIELKRDQR